MSLPKQLRDFIFEIRSALTESQERSLVQEECARMRALMKEDDIRHRRRNVIMLIYIHLLGYPTEFGQMECLKLATSSKFSEKRVGYLAVSLLVNEEVQLLLTSSLLRDMRQSDQTASLALCTLAAMCSPYVCEFLTEEVDLLMKSTKLNIKKKAILCASKMSRKRPDCCLEVFRPTAEALLSENDHGVLRAAVCLVTEMCGKSLDTLTHFRQVIPQLVLVLKDLNTAGCSIEHGVSGVNDPFLQVKILRLLGILGRNDGNWSRSMYDVLSQVLTDTDSRTNAGLAVLYEAVRTIAGIEPVTWLLELAASTVGQLLENDDNDVRYITLKMLLHVANIHSNPVQMYRFTVVNYLNDTDTSIQRRTMELCFALINHDNVCDLMLDLVHLLENCDEELKADICSNFVTAAEKYSPDKRWHVNTMITVLYLAGIDVPDDFVTAVIKFISSSPELHTYSVRQLFFAMQEDNSQQPLCQVASWCIGEYGEQLLLLPPSEEDEFGPVTEEQVVTALRMALVKYSSSNLTREYCLVALIKLSSRFSNTNPMILDILLQYDCSKLQQKAMERWPLDDNTRDEHTAPTRADITKAGLEHRAVDTSRADRASNGQSSSSQAQSGAVVDLLGPVDLSSNEQQAPVLTPSDQLAEIFGLPSNVAPVSTEEVSVTFDAFNKNGLLIKFHCKQYQSMPNVSTIFVEASNSTPTAMSDFDMQAAIPKSFLLEMHSLSGRVLPPLNGGTITLVMKVTNRKKEAIRMRLRIRFSQDGSPVTEMHTVNDFPPELWQVTS